MRTRTYRWPPGQRILPGATTSQRLHRHAQHALAKAGDSEAAVALVLDMVRPELIESIGARVSPDDIVVPVLEEERTGRNKIPLALAAWIGERTGARLELDIVQIARAYHTEANALERLLRRPVYEGQVIPGRSYVLVDDHITLGGTVSELADFIAAHGGQVKEVVVLSSSGRGSDLLAPPENLKEELRRKYGNVIQEELGIELEALTNAEAQYLDRFGDADSFRSRLVEERERTGIRENEGVISEEWLYEPQEPTEALIAQESTPKTAKEPWEMTREEFIKQESQKYEGRLDTTALSTYQEAAGKRHWASVVTAQKQGKPVPPEVLAEYPDLETTAGGAEIQIVSLSDLERAQLTNQLETALRAAYVEKWKREPTRDAARDLLAVAREIGEEIAGAYAQQEDRRAWLREKLDSEDWLAEAQKRAEIKLGLRKEKEEKPTEPWQMTYAEYEKKVKPKGFASLTGEITWMIYRAKWDPKIQQHCFRGWLPTAMQTRLLAYLSEEAAKTPEKVVKGTADNWMITHEDGTVALERLSDGKWKLCVLRDQQYAEIVRKAVEAGKDVPDKVLKERFPELIAKKLPKGRVKRAPSGRAVKERTWRQEVWGKLDRAKTEKDYPDIIEDLGGRKRGAYSFFRKTGGLAPDDLAATYDERGALPHFETGHSVDWLMKCIIEELPYEGPEQLERPRVLTEIEAGLPEKVPVGELAVGDEMQIQGATWRVVDQTDEGITIANGAPETYEVFEEVYIDPGTLKKAEVKIEEVERPGLEMEVVTPEEKKAGPLPQEEIRLGVKPKVPEAKIRIEGKGLEETGLEKAQAEAARRRVQVELKPPEEKRETRVPLPGMFRGKEYVLRRDEPFSPERLESILTLIEIEPFVSPTEVKLEPPPPAWAKEPMDHEALKRMVSEGGGRWVGIQYGARNVPCFVRFQDPGATQDLMVHVSKMSAEAVQEAIASARVPRGRA